MHEKDFQSWHKMKAQIDQLLVRPFFHEREIWFCHAGINIGFEQDGHGADFMRPIIIFRKFNNAIFWAIPLTRTEKRGKYYFQLVFQQGKESVAIISQIRLMDARRLSYKIGEISKDSFRVLIERVSALLPRIP